MRNTRCEEVADVARGTHCLTRGPWKLVYGELDYVQSRKTFAAVIQPVASQYTDRDIPVDIEVY
jgi:hypothetical protein